MLFSYTFYFYSLFSSSVHIAHTRWLTRNNCDSSRMRLWCKERLRRRRRRGKFEQWNVFVAKYVHCTVHTITDLLLLLWLAYWIRYQSECRCRVHHVHLIVTNYPPFVMRIWCESFICFLLLLLLRRHPISLNELNGIVIRIRFIAATCASATQCCAPAVVRNG